MIICSLPPVYLVLGAIVLLSIVYMFIRNIRQELK